MSNSPFSKSQTATSKRILQDAARQKKTESGPAAGTPEEQAKGMEDLRESAADRIIDSFGLILTPKQHNDMVQGAVMDSKGDFQVFKVRLHRRAEAWAKANPTKLRTISLPPFCKTATDFQIFCDEIGTSHYVINEIMGYDYEHWPKERKDSLKLALERIAHRKVMEIAETQADKGELSVPENAKSRKAKDVPPEEREAEEGVDDSQNDTPEGSNSADKPPTGTSTGARANQGPFPLNPDTEAAYRAGYTDGLARINNGPSSSRPNHDTAWIVWADVPTGRKSMPTISVTYREGCTKEDLSRAILDWFEGSLAGIKLINEKYPQAPAKPPATKPPADDYDQSVSDDDYPDEATQQVPPKRQAQRPPAKPPARTGPTPPANSNARPERLPPDQQVPGIEYVMNIVQVRTVFDRAGNITYALYKNAGNDFPEFTCEKDWKIEMLETALADDNLTLDDLEAEGTDVNLDLRWTYGNVNPKAKKPGNRHKDLLGITSRPD